MKFAKRSLGQNFLKDYNVINKITNLVDVYKKNIIEIGPGTGALTDIIIKKEPASLVLIEKDNSLYKKLKDKYKKNKIIKIYNSDILKFKQKNLKLKNYIIFGNLPYNISSQILVKIIKWPINFNDVIFMFQKELGEKIIGKFNTPHYGRLSILTNYRFKIISKFLVSPNCFFPKPKVLSMVIHFKPKENFYRIRKISNLEKVTNILFSNKRKMINKNLRKLLRKVTIEKHLKLKLNLRPSDLTENNYYKITELFEKK